MVVRTHNRAKQHLNSICHEDWQMQKLTEHEGTIRAKMLRWTRRVRQMVTCVCERERKIKITNERHRIRIKTKSTQRWLASMARCVCVQVPGIKGLCHFAVDRYYTDSELKRSEEKRYVGTLHARASRILCLNISWYISRWTWTESTRTIVLCSLTHTQIPLHAYVSM